ncbi:unnamed protein product [Linum tenue]|uniref:Uncharacterized protein n=1 Tax=Linum tenue TaxID=586396 RepID=A0AAV0LIV1_9ROSI|nr:unnamed protein product [Linum tenue]
MDNAFQEIQVFVGRRGGKVEFLILDRDGHKAAIAAGVVIIFWLHLKLAYVHFI